MPFVPQSLRFPRSMQLPFVGRTAERRWFTQQVLTPDEPPVHLIGVWGPPGIGTSALLARWREDADMAPGHNRCLTIFADGRAGSPLQIMRACAAQLRAAGAPLVAFEDLLDHLMAASRRAFSVEQQAGHTLFVRRVQDLARLRSIGGVPLIGGMYEATSRTTRDAVLQQYPALQQTFGQPFQERLKALTRAFLDDLNWLAAKSGQPESFRGRRIILFLDEITAVSHELLTWLRSQVLPAIMSMQVVLVLAGSDPLDRLFPAEQVTGLSLQPLTISETRALLATYGITDPTSVASLWQHSGGLPLALRLLALTPLDQVDGEEHAITIGIRALEQREPGYRHLIRYASLFSRSFSHHDLTVCPMFSAQEHIQWFRRLLDLPFVLHDPMSGGHLFHPLVQHTMLQRFEHEDRASYRQARQTMAQHYLHQLERLKRQEGEDLLREEMGQHLALALMEQWFRLADEASLRHAVEQVLLLEQQTTDPAALTFLLRTFAQAPPEQAVPTQSTHVAELLLVYGEADLNTPAFPEALTDLLARVGQHASFPASLQARIVGRRAAAFLLQEQPRLALADSTRAVTLDPTYTDGYLLRGIAAAALEANNEAQADIDQVISRDAHAACAYGHRSLIHLARRAYEHAVEDAHRVLMLAPDLPEALTLRSLVCEEMDEVRRGLGAFDYRLENHPDDTDALVLQGMAHCALGQHDQALASFARALTLAPTNPRVFAGRAHVHLERGDLEQAQADLARSWELDPQDGSTGLLLAWVRLCRGEPDDEISAWLETLAASIEAPDLAQICHGLALLLHQQFEEAWTDFDQVLKLYPEQREAAFWKGFACVFLQRDEEALAALKQARSAEIPLPTMLFTPLRRVAAVRPEFYQEQLLPLLQAAGSDGGRWCSSKDERSVV